MTAPRRKTRALSWRQRTGEVNPKPILYHKLPKMTPYDKQIVVTYRTKETRPLFDLIFSQFPKGKKRKFANAREMTVFDRKWFQEPIAYGMGPYFVYMKGYDPDYDKLTISNPKLALFYAGKRPRRD